jgi:SAM-dependent methyltransferase
MFQRTANQSQMHNILSRETSCPICETTKLSYLFIIRGLPVVRCPGCGLISLHPCPDPAECYLYYGLTADDEKNPPLLWTDSDTEREAAEKYVDALQERMIDKGRLLLIAPPGHPLAEAAMERGYEIGRHTSLPDIENGDGLGEGYSGAIVIYQFEKAADPLALLKRIHASLRPGGALLLSTPSVNNWPARFFGEQWTEWRPENRYYFDRTTIHSILLKSGFAKVWTDSEKRSYSLSHVYERCADLPRTLLTRSISFLYRIFPPQLRKIRLRLSTSRILVTAVKSALPSRPRLSIIVPVYNEKETFASLMDRLLPKQIDGMDREIILVESNSTDGTRELAEMYKDYPDVRLVTQERARGKGNAVRLGFQHAMGDVILIQDADLEYDLNDYEPLLEHILSYRAIFVLGARHGGNWKMRRFANQWSLATVMNIGHIFFTQLINILYRQKMRDPFTMYKIFRSDCLYGIDFKCNRFDFDHELVIKLVRKGYTPLETPVNYRSRSFKEGKKVRIFRDALSWLWVDFKLRFLPMSHWRRK